MHEFKMSDLYTLSEAVEVLKKKGIQVSRTDLKICLENKSIRGVKVGNIGFVEKSAIDRLDRWFGQKPNDAFSDNPTICITDIRQRWLDHEHNVIKSIDAAESKRLLEQLSEQLKSIKPSMKRLLRKGRIKKHKTPPDQNLN